MPSQLPLFPLRIVLFPGALLPLHIFELRYRQLLEDISAGNGRFGILAPGLDGGLPDPGTIGCVARLRGMERLDDGRSNIVVSGDYRCRFLGPSPAPTAYAQGSIERLDDIPDVLVPREEDTERLRTLGERYAIALQALRDEPLDLEFSAGPAELSFEVAALIEAGFEIRQQLLESRSASERVTRLLHLLPPLTRTGEDRALVHGRARNNGHGVLR